MSKAKLIIGAGTVFAVAVGAPKIIGELNNQQADPNAVVTSYNSLPIPHGDTISKLTGTALQATLYGDGHVSFSTRVARKQIAGGEVRCHDGKVAFDSHAVVHSALYQPTDNPAELDHASALCNGDKLSSHVLAPGSTALPSFILSQVGILDEVRRLKR